MKPTFTRMQWAGIHLEGERLSGVGLFAKGIHAYGNMPLSKYYRIDIGQ